MGGVGVGENAKASCVALKAQQIGPLGIREVGDEALGSAGAEVSRNSILAGVTEGRIADIVREASSGHDVAAVLVKSR